MRLEQAVTGRDPAGIEPSEPRRVAPRPLHSDLLQRGLLFVDDERRSKLRATLLEGRYVIAGESRKPAKRGRLRDAIEESVETALALRGALPPAFEVGAELGIAIRDQLFRVRALGATGIAIECPKLADRTDPVGQLGIADSETLRSWIEASDDAPVVLLMAEEDRSTRVLSPQPLEALVSSPDGEGEDDGPCIVALESDEPFDDEPSSPLAQALMERDQAEARALITPRAERLKAPVNLPIEAPTKVVPEPIIAAKKPVKSSSERVVDTAQWRSFAVELDEASGPRPVGMIEKLFTTRYMPLLGAAARGEVDGAGCDVLDAWRAGFEHSYRDGFASLRVTGKRPTMVLDAPEVAARIGRLNGARTVQLMLVDAMRFDVGEKVMARLAEQSDLRAVSVERSLLWSALPTTTPAQLALLARGPDGLRDPLPSEREPEITRGRAVSTLRRQRAGSRELMKLDLVEARLQSAGPPNEERLDAIADEVTPIIARFIESLPPRTLLFVFGDHGFRLPPVPDAHATGPATQGGASPEEVLVPGYAWLVGDVH